MADDREPPVKPALALTITVSGDEAFVDAVAAVGAWVGTFAGCPDADARTLGEALGDALGEVAKAVPGGRPPLVDLVVESTDRIVAVMLSCHAQADGAFPLEATLGTGDVADRLRALVDRVEFGREGDREICRFTRQVRSAR